MDKLLIPGAPDLRECPVVAALAARVQAAAVLELYLDPVETAPNRLNSPRLHPGRKTRLKNNSRDKAMHAYLEHLDRGGCAALPGPAKLHVVLRRSAQFDEDNVWGGLKWARDAIFNSSRAGKGLLPDDSPKWLRLGEIHWDTARKWKGQERTWFVLELLAPPATTREHEEHV